MRARPLLAVAAATMLAAVALPKPSLAGVLGNGSCVIGARPAATLLMPYFETNYDDPGQSTLISVTNVASVHHIVRVVLWTNYGIPTLAFDLYLKPFDIQTMNLADLMHGALPQTSEGANLSSFAHCTATLRPPGGAPFQSAIDKLRARHIGLPDPGTQVCAGEDFQDRVARGYVTIDVTDQCMFMSPNAGIGSPAVWASGYPSYYAPGNPNVLTGDITYIDNNDNQTDGAEAVHIVSDTDRFTNNGTFTFYGRYFLVNNVRQGAVDHRAPLSDDYFARFLNGSVFNGGTRLVVWREVPRTDPVPCAGRPNWWPLGQASINATDENGNVKTIFGATGAAFPLATQKVKAAELGGAALPGNFGALYLNLARPQGHAQAFVMPILSAQSRFSVGFNATRRNDLCGVQ